MKALVYTAPGYLEWTDWPEPEPSPGDALVRVEATGICGSDIAGFLGKSSRRTPPLILGHEVVGTVLRTPAGAATGPGRRVVANPLMTCGRCAACVAGRDNLCTDWKLLGMDRVQGAFAAMVAVQERNLYPVPPDMPTELALLVEPLANTVHLIRRLEDIQPKTVLLMGAGAQGTLCLMLLRATTDMKVAVVEVNSERRRLAQELGAHLVVDPAEGDAAAGVLRWRPSGVDVAIEAVGASDTRATCIRCVCKGGYVLLLGLHEQCSETDYAAVVRNEITLAGSFAYTRDDFERSLRLLTEKRIDPSPLVELRPMGEGLAAFEELIRTPGRTVKIGLRP